MYFEDFEIGMVFDSEIEPISFTEEEIIEAGKKFDPRPIHVDKKAAEASRFGQLILGGSYANLAFWSQWVKLGLDHDSLVAGVRVDGAQWLRPVVADTLYNIRVEISNKEVRKPGKDGFVTYKLTATDPDGQEVLIYEATGLVNFREKN